MGSILKTSGSGTASGGTLSPASPADAKTQTAEKLNLAEQIRKYRKKAGLSQQQLADLLKVSRNTVINWERGKYRPDADLFSPICAVLEINLNDLFGSDPALEEHVTAHERGMIRQYRLLSPAGRKIVDRMIGVIREEETAANNRLLDESVRMVYVISSAAAAGDGFSFSDIPAEDYRFVYKNERNAGADAIIRVKGDSMLPVYKEDDWVYIEYAPSAVTGEDVICSSREGLHIKRMGENGPYSLNTSAPFTLVSEDDRVEIIGHVLGPVRPADYPDRARTDILREIHHDEIEAFRRKYGISRT